MLIDGSTVHYLLSKNFGEVICDKSIRHLRVDYPILYDVTADMGGHSVLIPNHERPHSELRLKNSICICLNEASAAATRDAGFSVIQICGNATFPQMYNYLQSVSMRLERLDTQLHTYVDTRAGAKALLDVCAEATGCSLSLVDEQFQIVCEAAPHGASDITGQNSTDSMMLEDETFELFMASRNYQHMRSSRKIFAVPGSNNLLMKNVFFGSELKGVLICSHKDGTIDTRFSHSVLNYVSKFVENMFARMGSFGVSPTGTDRMRIALSQLLSGGAANQEDIEALLLENGHAPESTYAILHIERSFTFEGPEELDYLARHFELSWPRSYCFAVDGASYMFADIGAEATPAGRDFLKDILITARDNLSKVGISRSFTTMDQLDAARVQATAALTQGCATDPTYWFYRFDDYALSWLVDHGRGDTPLEYVLHPAVTALIQYDDLHQSDLLQSLSTFVRCRFNATKAAEELYVARSTLLNRLERIAELAKVDLDNATDRVYLSLSLWLADNRQITSFKKRISS